MPAAETTRVALVTGANRGIGLEIARQLADAGLEVVIGARDEAKARRAAEVLWDEGLDAVHPRVVDVAEGGSVRRLAERVARDLGRVDVLVNNAGVYLDRGQSALAPDLDVVRRTLETNTLGALRTAAAFVPGMRDRGYGRVVNVSSGMGALSDMGGGAPGYRLSKAGLNALTRMLQAELPPGTGVLVNSACPGWVRSDMGGTAAGRSLAEGADTPVWLATLPDDGPRGGFFRDREPIAF